MKVSVFIPAYNEEKIIEKNVLIVFKKLKSLKKGFELFIVDDTSSDQTGEIATALAKKHKEIHYLRYENGPSRRENLAASFHKAKGSIVIYMDLDLATSLDHLEQLINEIEINKNDVAIGSRYLGTKAKREVSRRIISVCYNTFMRTYFGSKVKDHQCGFKAFKKEVLLQLVKEAGYDKRFVRGWFWDTEILLRAQKHHFRIKEFPVKWRYGDSSSFILKREFRMMNYVLGLRKRL